MPNKRFSKSIIKHHKVNFKFCNVSNVLSTCSSDNTNLRYYILHNQREPTVYLCDLIGHQKNPNYKYFKDNSGL